MSKKIIDVEQFLDEHRFSPFQWTILVLCFLIVSIDGLDTAAMGYIAPSLIAEWHVSKAALAPVMSAALLGLAFGALTAGPLADRFGRKKVIVISALLFGLMTLASAAAWSPWSLTLFRFITGLGLGAALPNTVTLMSEYVPHRRRSLLSTLMFCGLSIGSASAGFIASAVIPSHGWRSLLITGGVLPLICVVFLAFILPESVRFMVVRNAPAERIARILRRISAQTDFTDARFVLPESVNPQNGSSSPVLALFQNNNGLGTVMLWLTYFMGLIIVYTVTGWMPTMMKDAGVPVAQAAIVTGMFLTGSTVGNIIMGWLMDRMSGYVVIAAAYAASALCLVAIALHPLNDVPMQEALVFLAGFAMGSQVQTVILATQFYRTQYRATGVSWVLGIGRFGGVFGASMGGILMSRGWESHEIFLALAVPAAIAASAIGIKGLYYTFRPNALPAASTESLG
ncbi:MFS transporter [Caballeronia sp. ATUFL_M1_KS5A]|uniref:MFS transporter n=1 Tax=Caballeronia sp. ATUFL_M1_KS5A TaxID=2921778 RepID=UPI0020283017|nr:MFS transporter [Caballeronia sp. ATUFL_M1_KS5A]